MKLGSALFSIPFVINVLASPVTIEKRGLISDFEGNSNKNIKMMARSSILPNKNMASADQAPGENIGELCVESLSKKMPTNKIILGVADNVEFSANTSVMGKKETLNERSIQNRSPEENGKQNRATEEGLEDNFKELKEIVKTENQEKYEILMAATAAAGASK